MSQRYIPRMGLISDKGYKPEKDMIAMFKNDLEYTDVDGKPEIPAPEWTGTETSEYDSGAVNNFPKRRMQNEIWAERIERLNWWDKWAAENHEPTVPDTHYTFNHNDMYNWFIKGKKNAGTPYGLNKVKHVPFGDLNYNIYNIRPKSTYEIPANGGRRLYEAEAYRYTDYPINNEQVYPQVDLVEEYVKLKYPKY